MVSKRHAAVRESMRDAGAAVERGEEVLGMRGNLPHGAAGACRGHQCALVARIRVAD